MRGVILAGGTGSRLRPITNVINKHLLPVGRVPMIYHPILKLKEAGINQILIVTGPEHLGDLVRQLRSGRSLQVDLTYRVQEEALGIAHALRLAEDWAGHGEIAVILGDNVFDASLRPMRALFSDRPKAAGMIAVSDVGPARAHRFGVAYLDPQGENIVRIVEKPTDPTSTWAVTGIYFYRGVEPFELIDVLHPSARGELEITDLNNLLIDRGSLIWWKLPGRWTDAGTFESLAVAGKIAVVS